MGEPSPLGLLQTFQVADLCLHPLGYLGVRDFGYLWPCPVGEFEEPEPTQVDFVVYDPPHIYSPRDLSLL